MCFHVLCLQCMDAGLLGLSHVGNLVDRKNQTLHITSATDSDALCGMSTGMSIEHCYSRLGLTAFSFGLTSRMLALLTGCAAGRQLSCSPKHAGLIHQSRMHHYHIQ